MSDGRALGSVRRSEAGHAFRGFIVTQTCTERHKSGLRPQKRTRTICTGAQTLGDTNRTDSRTPDRPETSRDPQNGPWSAPETPLSEHALMHTAQRHGDVLSDIPAQNLAGLDLRFLNVESAMVVE